MKLYQPNPLAEHVADTGCPKCLHPLKYTPSDPRDADDAGHGSLTCGECEFSADAEDVREYERQRTERGDE